jgi:hypothetical protein
MAASLDKVKIGDRFYYSILLFMEMNGIKSKQTVYNWSQIGKVQIRKIGKNSYFTKA